MKLQYAAGNKRSFSEFRSSIVPYVSIKRKDVHCMQLTRGALIADNSHVDGTSYPH